MHCIYRQNGGSLENLVDWIGWICFDVSIRVVVIPAGLCSKGARGMIQLVIGA